MNLLQELKNSLEDLHKPFSGFFIDPVENEWVEGVEIPKDTRTHEEIIEEIVREERYRDQMMADNL